MSVFVSGSILISVVAGTCFMQTAILIFTALPLKIYIFAGN